MRESAVRNVPHLACVSTEFVLIGCVLRKRSVFTLYFTHPHLFNENKLRTHTLARCGTFTLPEMLKSNFFSAKNFNIFYDFGREKNPTSAIRAPIKPVENPLKPVENPLKHLEIPRCFVFHPLYWAKKRGKNPVFRALSSSLVQR